MVSAGTVLKPDRIQTATFVGRLCLSAIFLVSGVGKVISPQSGIAAIQSLGLPFPAVGLALAAAIELLCGTALLFGLQLRWTASILAIFTILTATFFHSSFADPNQLTHFLKNVAITGGLLHVIVLGPPTRRR